MKPIGLEFSEGKSQKFWNVTVNGTQVMVRYGRIGTEGRPAIKSFGSRAEAVEAAEELARAKRKKGYVDARSTTEKRPQTPTTASRPTRTAPTSSSALPRRVEAITAWLSEHQPEEAKEWTAKRPAPEAAIAKVERRLGHALPPDFREYLQIHNGTGELADVVWGRLHPVQELVQETEDLQDLLGREPVERPELVDARIKPVHFSPGWVAISTSARNRDHLCIDLDPERGGTTGQVILVSVDSGGRHEWLAESFDDLLDYYLRGYLQGKRKEPTPKRRAKLTKIARGAPPKGLKRKVSQQTLEAAHALLRGGTKTPDGKSAIEMCTSHNLRLLVAGIENEADALKIGPRIPKLLPGGFLSVRIIAQAHFKAPKERAPIVLALSEGLFAMPPPRRDIEVGIRQELARRAVKLAEQVGDHARVARWKAHAKADKSLNGLKGSSSGARAIPQVVEK